MRKSQYFSPRAVIALERIGDRMCPKNGDFPSYSECGCVEHVDKMIAYAPENDIKDLNMVLVILSFMPGFVIGWLLRKMSESHSAGGGIQSIFRQLDFGLKGIILGTYYSGKAGKSYKGKLPTEVIGFELKRMV